MTSWPTGAWIAAGAAVVVAIVMVWLRLRTSPEPAVQVIAPAHRSARVEDRLKQLRTEWATRGEHDLAGGQIPNRQAPPAQLPMTPTPAASAPEDEAGAAAENPGSTVLDDALAQDEPDLNALKQVIASDPDPQNRLTAVMLVSTIEDPSVVPVLAQALKDSDSDVRLMAVQALGEFSGPEPLQAVETALNDSDPEIRFEALSVLADLGGDSTRAVIQRALKDEDEDVRALAEGLLSMDEPSAEPPTARPN